MVQIVGYLKDDAMYGEKRVLESLAQNLPKEWSVYVECPLHHKSLERMPDFIVVTNFGIIVLEVKDWVNFQATRVDVTVHSRSGKTHVEHSPVNQARRMAEILAQMLESKPQLMRRDRGKLKVPWGYAVVFAHAGPRHLQELRALWGEHYVMGLDDLQPRIVTRRLKDTLPFDYSMRSEDLEAIRDVVNPTVSISIETGNKAARQVTLDATQESLVVEPPRAPAPTTIGPRLAPAPKADQLSLIPRRKKPKPAVTEAIEEQPEEVQALTENVGVRLVRGVAGSGKTVVLLQRARYLAAQHPQWQIAVLTYNKALQEMLQANLKGIPNIKVTTFDALCSALLKTVRPWMTPANPEGWLRHDATEWPVVGELGVDFIAEEIKWIKDTGVLTRDAYLEVERKGRGQGLRRGGRLREGLWDVLEAYNAWLATQNTCDWADLAHLVRSAIDDRTIAPDRFDALLIDEGQDFAPSWFGLLRQLINPETGLLFITDDPSQSIFRSFSWHEKGITVAGRTRWLRVPYRNTREIYEAAYEVIRDDELIKQELTEQTGELLVPDLANAALRHGPRPQIREFRTIIDEQQFIGNEIHWLMQTQGLDPKEIVVLHRRNSGVRWLQSALRKTGVKVAALRSLKGLEYEAVFLAGMETTFPESAQASAQALSAERRLVYMAMTRARERLYLSYAGKWPTPLASVVRFADVLHAM